MIGIKTLVSCVCLTYWTYHVIANGLMTTSVDTIQARYSLNSVNVGIILASMDIGNIIMQIVIAFSGENINKPRWICGSSISIGIGAIVFSIPYFSAPPYVYKNIQLFNYCGNVTSIGCNDNSLKYYMVVFIGGTLLIGAGSSSIFTHGLTYIDDNTNNKQSSIYTSIFYTMAALGPVIGYIMGGTLTEIYVDPMESVKINSSHPLWVGAWWPGYLACGITIIVLAFSFTKLPKKLINQGGNEMENSSMPSENNWQKRYRSLITNPIFVLTTIVMGLNQAFIKGFNSFATKYVTAQYGLTTMKASLTHGITGVVSLTLGHICGGAIVAKYELKVRGIIKLCVATALLSAVFTFAPFFYCSDDKFAGVTVDYVGVSNVSTMQLNLPCNQRCECSTDGYKPVRGADRVMYYSACYAGCALDHRNGSYSYCACVNYGSQNASMETQTATEVSTISGEFCWMLIGYAAAIGIAFFTSIMTVSPTTQLTMRCVSEYERSSAISAQQVVALLIGNIPGRVLTGKVIDVACVVWATKCGEQASCKVYKKWDMALYTFLLLQIEAFIIFFLYVAIYFVHRTQSKTRKVEGVGNPAFDEIKEDELKTTKI